MRYLFAILAALTLTSCASTEDRRFHVGESPRAFVIVGVAEAAANTSAQYDVLWRRLDAEGAFSPVAGDTSFQAETNSRNTIRIRGIPGEFALLQIEPGTYALDSVFALIRDRRVNYIANGLVRGPSRPSFQVAPGEAVYLGIWQVDIVEANATVSLWRLSESDLRAVAATQNAVLGDIRIRRTEMRDVPCTPQRLHSRSQRQVC